MEQKSDEPVTAAKAANEVCLGCLHLIWTIFAKTEQNHTTDLLRLGSIILFAAAGDHAELATNESGTPAT